MARRGRYVGQIRPAFSRLHDDRDLAWLLPFRVPYLAGVAGQRFAGKSSVLSYLAERYGFRVFTLSAQLREIARERGVAVADRESLKEFGEEIRALRGDPGVLARETLNKIRRYQLAERGAVPLMERLAVGGLKHVAELDVLQRIKTFELFYVSADPEIRLRRAEDELRGIFETRKALGQLSGSYRRLNKPAKLALLKEWIDDPEETPAAAGRFGTEVHARPSELVSRAKRVAKIDTSTDSLRDLHTRIDELLRTRHEGGARFEG